MVETGWTAGSAASATGATLQGPADLAVTAICTDTRRLEAGALYVPLRGEQFDGHQFIPQAWERGAAAVVSERECECPAGRAVLRVADTMTAYGDLGRAWRRRYAPLVVAVTGSVGKSSTKELVAAVLGTRLTTLRSPASYNNEVGVPATLLGLRPEHEAVVLELAMRGRGQIDYLAGIAEPRVGVITNIGSSHVGLLGSREAIAQAKGELLDHLGPDGTAVLNADDPHLPGVAPRHCGRTIWYGTGPAADLRAEQVESRGLEGSTFRLVTPEGETQVRLGLPGRHMVVNALAAAAVGYVAGLALEALQEGIQQAGALPLRMEVARLQHGARVVVDAYNAAPDSVRAALEVMRTEPVAGRRIAVLGDMLELGDLAEVEHLQVGHDAALVADVVVAVGELGAHIGAGARDQGCSEVRQVADAAAAGRLLAELVQPGDLVLLKASRLVGLERALEALEVEA